MAAVAATAWLSYCILHDHVTITQAFHEAGDRMRGVFVPIVDAVRALLPLPAAFTADAAATEPPLPKPRRTSR